MNKIFLSVILLFSYSVIPLLAQESYRFTLEECLQYAFDNSYERQSTKIMEESRQAAYEQSKLERLPDLSASASEGFTNNKEGSSWSGSASLSSGMQLYSGGAITSAIETARLESELAQSQTAQYDNAQTIQILQAFLNVLSNEESLSTREELFAATEEQLRQGEAMLRAGSILESDLLLLRAQRATEYSTIVNTRAARDNSLLSLKNLLSMPPEASLEIIYPEDSEELSNFLLPSQQEVVSRAMQTLPEMQADELNILIAQEGIRRARSGFLPKLSLSASVSSDFSDFDNIGTQLEDGFGQRASLSLSIPIFNKGSNRLALNQSKMTAKRAELDAAQSELNLRQMVVTQYQDVMSLYAQYQAGDLSREASRQSYEAYRARFEQGSITTVDLLQQQNSYLNALNSYVQYKYGFMLNRKVLDVYMGEKIN
jgi:outer membrane protein